MALNKTQGMQVFGVINQQIQRFVCPQNVKFGQDSFGKIEVTCLDAESKQYVRGIRDPGEAGIGINYDDENDSHEELLKIAESGEVIDWYVGSSHSKEPPNYEPTTGISLPDSRNWWSFKGYMNDTAPGDIEVDNVMKYDFVIVRTSKVTRTRREVA